MDFNHFLEIFINYKKHSPKPEEVKLEKFIDLMNKKYEHLYTLISKLLTIYDGQKNNIKEIEVDQFLEITYNHKLSEITTGLKEKG